MKKSRTNSVNQAQVRKMIAASRLANAELKSFGTAQTAQTPSVTGTIWNLTQGITNGDASSQRDGNQINAMSVAMRITASSATTNAVRFLLIQDHMNNGVNFAVTDVLRFADYISSYSNLILNEQKRFKVLHDATIDLSATGENKVTRGFTTKRFTRKITYLGDADATASNGRNSMFLIVISDTILAAYDFDFQIRFLDQ